MKCLVILIFSVISLVAADGGEYVPRAFYFLDENGRPSIPQPIRQETLNRVRRQAQQGFNPNFGGGFAFPQPVFSFPQIQPGAPGTQGSFVSSSQTLSSRFGEDEPVMTGHTQTFHSSGNQYQQTNTYIGPDGKVTTNKQSGRVKRDMSQTQSQGSDDGKTQFQSQVNAPGGTQIQSQSQPGMSQTQSQGGEFPVKGSFDHVQEPDQEPLNAAEIPTDRAQSGAPLQPPPQQRPPPQHVPQGQQNPQHVPQGQQHPQQQFPQGQQHPQQGQHVPQGQQHPQQQYPQGQQYPQQGQQPYYPQGQGQQFPFGFGQFGFPQAGFGFPQAGFGFPQAGFGFPQAGFAQPGFVGPAPGSLDNRFGEDEVPGTVVGGSQVVTSQNGNYQITSSVLRPDGQVVTSQQSGKFPKKT